MDKLSKSRRACAPARRRGEQRTLALIAVALVVCVLAGGCTLFGAPNVHDEDNPYTRDAVIRRVAVAPFIFSEKTENLSYGFELLGADFPDGRFVLFSTEIAREFAQELAQFRGFEVVPPAEVLRAWQESRLGGDELNPLAGAEDARALARHLRADAIVVGEIRSYDPYDYPRVEFAWQLLYTARHNPSSDDIRRIERSGVGRPFALGKDYSKYPLYAANEVVDSRIEHVHASLEDYGYSLRTRGGGYESGAAAIRKRAWPDYFRFASWYALRGAFDYERARR